MMAKCKKYPLQIGMTAAEAKASYWCYPSHINTTTTAGNPQTEQWVYDGRPIGNDHKGYLYFTDGVLTAVQESN
jgi:hypothetical protein